MGLSLYVVPPGIPSTPLGINFNSVLFQNKSPSYSDGLYVATTAWYLQESNQGHTDFQSVALPTELRYQYFNSFISPSIAQVKGCGIRVPIAIGVWSLAPLPRLREVEVPLLG